MTRPLTPRFRAILSACVVVIVIALSAGIVLLNAPQSAEAANPVLITAPTPGQTSATSMGVDGTADVGDLITVVVTPSGEGTGCTATADSSGNWSCTTSNLVTDPDLTFTATRGGASAPPDLDQVTVSNILPPTMDGIVGGQIRGNDDQPTFTGTGYPGAEIRIAVDTNDLACAADGTTGAYSCPWTGAPLATNSTDAGPGYVVTFHQVVENVLISPNDSTTYRLDTFTSVPQFSSPAVTTAGQGADATATTTDSTPTLSGTAEPGASVDVYAANAANAPPGFPVYCSGTADAGGTWTCTGGTGFAPGVESMGLVATDTLGNMSPSPDSQLNLTIGNPSTPTVDSGLDGSSVYDPNFHISGTSNDSSGGTVTVADLATSGTFCTAVVAANGSWGCNGTLVQGIQTLRFSVQALGGGTSGTDSIGVQLRAPASPTFTTPAAGSTTADPTLTFAGSADGSILGSVTVKVNGTVACSGLVGSDDGAWSCSGTVPRGTDVATATQTDTYGLTGPLTSVSFKAVTPAAPIITSPLDGATLLDPSVAFTGSARGFSGGTVKITDANGGLCQASVNANSFWSCTATLIVGDHAISAVASDAAGTTSPAATETVTELPLIASTALPAVPTFDWTLGVYDLSGNDLSGGSIVAGTAIMVGGGGIPVGYTSDAVLHSTPFDLGSELIGSTGTYLIPTTIPADTPPGAHDIIVTTTGPTGDSSVRDVPVTISAPAAPASGKAGGGAGTGIGLADTHGGRADKSLGLSSATSYSSALQPFQGFSVTPAGIAVTSVAAGGFLVFVAVPSEILESTVRENYGIMFGWLTPARRRFDRWRARVQRIRIPQIVASTLMVVVTSLILGFSSPEFGFNGASLRLVFALFISLAVVNVGISEVVQLVARKRLRVSSSLNAMPATLLLVIASVLVSRAIGAEPGFLFGVVLGISYAAELGKRRQGLLTLLATWLSLGVGVGSWLAYSAIVSAHIHSPGFWILLVQEALVTMTAEAMATLVIRLLPLEFLDGKLIWKWSKLAWLGTYAVALVLFILVILPSSNELGRVGISNWGWALVFLGFSLVAIGLWITFRIRRRYQPEK